MEDRLTSPGETDERYRRFVTEDFTGVLVMRTDGQIVTCNPAVASIPVLMALRPAIVSVTTMLVPPIEHLMRLNRKESSRRPYLVRQYLTNFGFGFGCFLRQRRNLSALERNDFLVRPSIGQALADDTLCRDLGAGVVVNAKRGAV